MEDQIKGVLFTAKVSGIVSLFPMQHPYKSVYMHYGKHFRNISSLFINDLYKHDTNQLYH